MVRVPWRRNFFPPSGSLQKLAVISVILPSNALLPSQVICLSSPNPPGRRWGGLRLGGGECGLKGGGALGGNLEEIHKPQVCPGQLPHRAWQLPGPPEPGSTRWLSLGGWSIVPLGHSLFLESRGTFWTMDKCRWWLVTPWVCHWISSTELLVSSAKLPVSAVLLQCSFNWLLQVIEGCFFSRFVFKTSFFKRCSRF